jgi:hypothetical protein
LQAVEGAAQTGKLVEALAKGDGVDRNDLAFGTAFPYVALPHTAAVNEGKALATGDGNGSKSSSAAGSGTGAAAVKDDDDSSNAAGLIAVGLVAGLAAGAGAMALRRKRA